MAEPTPPESIISPLPSFLHRFIAENMKYKERSHTTLYETHKPGLELTPPEPSSPSPSPSPSFDVLFIGDSMLERLKTTGVNTKLHNLPRSFNLGVGGDKIENVLYRLNEGYITLLTTRTTKIWVVHIGSNNLSVKRGLRPDIELSNYRILLQTLLLLSPKSVVFVTGVFRRKDVKDEIVRESNEGIIKMVEDMNAPSRESGREERLVWVPPAEAVDFDVLADQAHLNEDGYRIWDEDLYPRVIEALNKF
ncbi:hypothetical protein H072_2038 [Dactylellina haptotyla CBS 200.50]|uniref:SGNH hydrolase-type esterase domain-containing protein n=1 Tax=Dactylellina haptotyla (strain CBS 200.50) TaxID=1284197 RepID=S8C8F5_DACHA|nr:hypothetical protein H072_2038 [Dactylellina haptotyla CBS 200.50]